VVNSRGAEDDRNLRSNQAWSVSLNPKGETYASCGGSGNVFVHSAQTENFGERLSTLTTGRHKFGMHCSHVCVHPALFRISTSSLLIQSPDGRRLAMSSETGQIFIFDLEKSALATTYTSHAMPVRSLSWSSDSSVCGLLSWPYVEYPLTISCLSSSLVHLTTNASRYTTSEVHREDSLLQSLVIPPGF